jgi:hypothetical protein
MKYILPKINKATCILYCVMLYFCQTVKAQLDNTFLESPFTFQDENTWGVSIYNHNYIRNTEYFNPIEKGRTLFGYQLNPSLYLQPTKQVKLQAGIFLQSNFGETPVINTILPTFSLKFSNKSQDLFLLFGTLEGALSHRLIEPLFDINSGILNRIENGIQFKVNKPHVFLDTWINWEKFIEPNAPYQEQFTSGINFTPSFNKNTWRFSIPIQATIFHRGGQIDNDSSNMILMYNGAVGLDIQKKIIGGRFKQIGISGYSVISNEQTSSGYLPFRTGSGILANLFTNFGNTTLMFSYWNANTFIAPKGTHIYQSVSYNDPSYTTNNRTLLFFRLLYQKEIINSLTVVGRVEPFYDFGYKQVELCFSFYLSYRFEKALGKLTKE